MKKLILLCVLFLFTSLCAEEVFQVGVVNTLQLHPASTPVEGIKLNLVNSSTDNFTGLDVGFFSQVNKDFTGIQFNTINFNNGNSTGLQFGEVFISIWQHDRSATWHC
ncbi:MAG: hypothetical protein P9X26_09220 [Candidatus Stygibacter frigidus]|nr:hypothetical protein [Candidatus Stygibacter frigidus]